MRRACATALLLAGCGASGDPTVVFGDPDPWPQPALLPASTGPRLVITNSGDDTVSFVDAATFTEVGRVPVGVTPLEREGPHHVAPAADGRHVFVGIANAVPLTAKGPHGSHGDGTADGYLLRLDTATGRETGRARVKRNPGDVRLDPSGKLVWQSHFDVKAVLDVVMNGGPRADMDSFLVATDAETLEKRAEIRVCPTGHGIAFSADGKSAYVSCYMTDELAVVDLVAKTARRVVLGPNRGAPPAPSYAPYAVSVSPADGRVWVSAQGGAESGLLVYDPRTGMMDGAAAVRTAGLPGFGTFAAAGATLYVVTQQPSHLLEIDPATSRIRREVDLPGCAAAHAVKASPDEKTLWVVCEGDHVRTPGTLHRLDAATFMETGRISVGLYPDDIGYLP